MEYGSERVIIRFYEAGEVIRKMKHYKVRVKINGSQDEMTEFIRFTDKMGEYRKAGKLVVDKNDPTTRPSFVLDYPKDDIDGSYFIIKCYTILA